MWSNTPERDRAYSLAVYYICIFAFLAVMLATSIVQTIRTNPGSIPEDKEWDMLTDSVAESNSSEGDDNEVRSEQSSS